MTSRYLLIVAVAGLASSALGQNSPGAAAQPVAPAAAPATPVVQQPVIHTGDPRRDTMVRLTRRISVDFQEKRLEDIMTFVKDFTAADIEPLWTDDANSAGLDKDKAITVKVENTTVLALLEKIAEKARGDSGEITWQMTDTGTLQFSTKDRLNKYTRVEIYDINDLLQEVPDYRDVPQIDLQQALQAAQGGQGGGGGGGRSPFKDEQRNQQQRDQDRMKQAEDLQKLITDLVENEQWVDNGGSGGTVRYYRGTLIVKAPDYMHRGINGYPWWASTATVANRVQGRRYVTLTTDNGLSRVNGFGQQPVTAVVGGQLIPSGGGGGR